MRMAQGTSNLLGANRPALFMTATNATSPSNTTLLAIDAPSAADGGLGSPGLLWTGQIPFTSCSVSGINQDQLLIGSDGTVYVTCSDGAIEAWAADGDPSTGSPPGRLGLLKWKSAAPLSWSGALIAPRAAIGKTSSGDVLYVARTGTPTGLAILNLATATNGSLPIEVNVDGAGGILTDATGRAIALGASASNRELSIVSPTGTVLFSDKGTWWPSGFSAVLTGEGHLLMAENPPTQNSQKLTAVTVNNPTQVSTLFSLQGAGGLSTDANMCPVVISSSVYTGGLLFFDYPPTGSTTNRHVTGLPYAGNPGPMPNAWSARFGDPQRRNSLKTQ
jgi:hypothetical protein